MSTLETAPNHSYRKSVASSWKPIRTIGRCGFLVGALFINAACGVPVDSAEPADTTESSAPLDPTSEDVANTIAPIVPLALVDDCVDQTMGRAFSGEEFWVGHWNNMNQDEAQLRQWCNHYGLDDPAALADLSRQWQELVAAEVTDSGTVAPPSVVPFADPVVASYANCDAVRAAGADPIRRGDPGYGSHLDSDDDGIGCE